MVENKNAKTPTDDGQPVAWISHIPTKKVNGKQLHWTKEQAYKWSSDITPLYTAPKQWVGLTDEDMEALFLNEDGVRFARYIEAKLREKNHG